MSKSSFVNKLESINVIPVSLTETSKIIAASSAKASAIAALPIPIIDVVGVSFVQIDMVNKIADKYQVASDARSNLVISTLAISLIGKLVSSIAGKLSVTTKLDKMIGESLIKATISGFVTTITGEVFESHFRKGGNIHDISIDDYFNYFKTQLKSDRISIENVGQNALSGIMNKFDIA